MTIARLLAGMLFCLILSGVAEAKWWIFGQANDDVSISYLYLNNIPFEESGEKLTIFRDLLPGGELIVRGKARAGKGKIGGVSISLDNRESWKEAQFSPDGDFEYRFRPEVHKSYRMYVEVVDTAGKANDVDSTGKEIIVAEGSYQTEIRQVLDAMITAYRAEDPAAFMVHVSDNFAADPTVLDRAIRRDFSLFDNIDLRYTLNSIATGQGNVYAAISFTRQITSTRSGTTLTDRGSTDFVFQPGDRGLKVFSMRFPLIFGLSDSDEVATGTVNDGSNPEVIIVTDSGDIAVVPFNDAVDNTPAEETVESGFNIAITTTGHPPQGFDFTLGEPDIGAGSSFVLTGGDTAYAYGFLTTGHAYRDLGSVTLNSVSDVPADGYNSDSSIGHNFYAGHTYAFRLPNGNYAVMEVKDVNMTPYPSFSLTMRIDYKYQPDGSRNF